MTKRFLWTCEAIGGILGCVVVAYLGLPEIAFIPPGFVATWGIGALLVTAGEENP